jgi:hypothetical protein
MANLGKVERWTPSIIDGRLVEAAWLADAMPLSNGTEQQKLAVLATEGILPRASRTIFTDPPRHSETQRLREVMNWLGEYLSAEAAEASGLPWDTARVLWCRAGGVTWLRLMDCRNEFHGGRMTKGGPSQIPGGNSHVSLRAICVRAIDHLAIKLNDAKVRPVEADKVNIGCVIMPGQR